MSNWTSTNADIGNWLHGNALQRHHSDAKEAPESDFGVERICGEFTNAAIRMGKDGGFLFKDVLHRHMVTYLEIMIQHGDT